MNPLNDRASSCYPDGLMPTRRAFLRTLGAAAAAAGASAPAISTAVQGQKADEPIPGFPPGGFPDGSTRMNFNENPLGPSKKVIDAVLENGLDESNRYNYIDPLVEAIARHHAIPEHNVLVGCGSTEFLQFTPWAFLGDGGSIVLPAPSYGWSAGVAEAMGRQAIRVPLGEGGVIDTAAMKKAIRSDTRMVYLANPNNPTGAPISRDEIVSLIRALPGGAVLIVDEAYHDFLPDGDSSLELVGQDAPVLVLRTFSKAYGIAGLRLGYAVAGESVLEKVRTVWWGDFGINTAALIAGPAALADQAHVRRYVALIDKGLEQLRSGLRALGITPLPHRAPFFMADFGVATNPLVRSLQDRQIFVQPGAKWGMPTFMRISVGTSRDNEVFLDAIRALRV
jgi:histidinol-phosphate aminotransferase